MKIAFVGHAAVGKDTLSDYAARKLQLIHISSGNLVREHVRLHNLGTLERENLIKIGNDMRAEFGGDCLVRMAFKKHHDNIVLSGLRAIDEVETFKSLGGKVIAVTASPRRRYELALIRNRIGDHVTFEEWLATQASEFESLDSKKQNIEGVISAADFTIENSSTLDELYQKCDEVLKQIS